MSDTALPHLTAWCQRWHQGRHSWVHRRHGGFNARRYHTVELPEAEAKRYVLRHHYAHSWPSARMRFGMVDRHDGSLCGVLVLGVPVHQHVLTRPFPDLEPYTESLDLARLVLGDVPANGESWFTTAALRMAAERGARGVVAFADPIPRIQHTPDGPVTISPGHAGTIYQACSAIYTGLATPRSLIMLPNATVLNARAVAKLVGNERGARGVVARLLVR
ncbi:hypothetical protein [Micromonospora sp. NPDC049107]|uniref:Mom family adenine methylcarbamoylation protein n=1 Tax=unclassified Micromonospora TaxID=2617518 RepID=UPI0033DF8E9B